jgi:hypothetical protein
LPTIIKDQKIKHWLKVEQRAKQNYEDCMNTIQTAHEKADEAREKIKKLQGDFIEETDSQTKSQSGQATLTKSEE